jgi:hypothetical protein
MKKFMLFFLMINIIGLFGVTKVDAQIDYLSCSFECPIDYRDEGFKEITILTVVRQTAKYDGCVDIVLFDQHGWIPLGTRIKLGHNDTDKINICKWLYEAKRDGMIPEIPQAGNIQVRLNESWLNLEDWPLALSNLEIHAWTTNYTTSRQFPFRGTDVDYRYVGGSSKTNCVFMTKWHDEFQRWPSSPENWMEAQFVDNTGDILDWLCCGGVVGPTGPTGPCGPWIPLQ